MKLEAIDRNDPQTLKMHTGVSWVYLDEVVADDSLVLVFKHPTDSSLGAMTSKEDLDLSFKGNVSNFESY